MWSVARLTSLLLGAVLLAGARCQLSTDNDDAESDVRRAQARWHRSGVQDYQIVVQYLCFCAFTRPVRITVRFGNIVSRVDAETGQPVPAEGNHVRDVAGLFDLVLEAIDRDAARVDASYDATYGYPKMIDIDYLANAIDDELQIKTSEFQPLR